MIKIGIDWGKTSVRIAASNGVGEIVHFQKKISKPIPKTWDLFIVALENIISEFLISEKIEWQNISQIIAGVAGVLTHFQPQADCKINSVPTVVDNDVMMLAKTIPLKDAILCYAGTGAITIFSRNDNLYVFGGEGQFLGDPGSGFHLGQSIIRTELRKLALTNKISPALEKIFAKTNTQSANELLLKISNSQNIIQEIARIVKMVGWELIVQDCIEEITQSWEEVMRKLNKKTIILAGGIFLSNSRIIESLVKKIPKQEFYLLETEPSHLFSTFDFENSNQIAPAENFLTIVNA